MKNLFLAAIALLIALNAQAQTYSLKIGPEIKRTGMDQTNFGDVIGMTQKGYYVLFTPLTSKNELVQYDLNFKEISRVNPEREINGQKTYLARMLNTKTHTYMLYLASDKASNKSTLYTQQIENEVLIGSPSKILEVEGFSWIDYWQAGNNKGVYVTEDSSQVVFVYDIAAEKGKSAVKVVSFNAELKKQWEQNVAFGQDEYARSIKVNNDGTVGIVSRIYNLKNRHKKETEYEYRASVVNEDGVKTISCDFSEEIAPKNVTLLKADKDEVLLCIGISKEKRNATGILVVKASTNTGKPIEQTIYNLKASDVMDEKKAASFKGTPVIEFMSIFKSIELADGTVAVVGGYDLNGWGGQEVVFLVSKDLKVKAIRIPNEEWPKTINLLAQGNGLCMIQTDIGKKIAIYNISTTGSMKQTHLDIPNNYPVLYVQPIDKDRIFVRVGTDYTHYAIITAKP